MAAPGGGLDLTAFRLLYPEVYYAQIFSQGVRPDGRPLGRCRPTSVALGAVPVADGSALVKIGNTAVLAAVKLEFMKPSSDAPNKGQLVINFQMPAICSPNVRPGRPSEEAFYVNEQLDNILRSSALVNEEEFCIEPRRFAWKAYLDIYCLDADGSLLDAALLASVASLTDLQLPAISITRQGQVLRQNGDMVLDEKSHGDVAEGNGEEMACDDDRKERTECSKRLRMGSFPVGLTCALYKDYLLTDPSADEEALANSSVNVAFAGDGRLVSLQKAGGSLNATIATLQDCMAAAQLRLKEVQQLLKDVCDEAGISLEAQ